MDGSIVKILKNLTSCGKVRGSYIEGYKETVLVIDTLKQTLLYQSDNLAPYPAINWGHQPHVVCVGSLLVVSIEQTKNQFPNIV